MDDQLFKGDDGNALRFYYLAPKNNFQTERTGSPKFDKALMVDVLTPGSNESAPTFELEREYCTEAGIEPARSEKYEQYKPQIEAFKRGGGEGAIDGTPLKTWPQVDVAQVATLNAQHIYSVEQLAAVSDGNLDKIGLGARALRDQAIAFINSRTFAAPTAAMQSRMSFLETENARLTAELAASRAAAPTPGAVPAIEQVQPAPAPADLSGLGTPTFPGPAAAPTFGMSDLTSAAPTPAPSVI